MAYGAGGLTLIDKMIRRWPEDNEEVPSGAFPHYFRRQRSFTVFATQEIPCYLVISKILWREIRSAMILWTPDGFSRNITR